MKKLLLFLALVPLVASCAPDHFFMVQTLEGPSLTAAEAEKIPLDVYVERFNVPEDVPYVFESYFSSESISYAEEIEEGLTRSFSEYLAESGLFKSVKRSGSEDILPETELVRSELFRKGITGFMFGPLLKSERFMYMIQQKKKESRPDIKIVGKVKRFNWRETGSLWTTTALCVFTLDIYPLVGGGIAWPEAEAEIEITLVSMKTGEEICSFISGNMVEDSISIYNSHRDTPAVQLMQAWTNVSRDLLEQMERKAPEIRRLYSGEKPETEEDAAEPEKTDAPEAEKADSDTVKEPVEKPEKAETNKPKNTENDSNNNK